MNISQNSPSYLPPHPDTSDYVTASKEVPVPYDCMCGKPHRLNSDEAEALFSVLLNERQCEIMALVCGITGDYHASQDIVQEVFIKLHCFLHHRKIDGRLVGWLRKVARNAAIDYRRRRFHFDVALTAPLADMPDSTSAPCDVREYLCYNLAKTLSRLPDRQREVFEMRVMDEYTFGQIAAQMGISETNCRSIYHRVCKRLRKTVSQGLHNKTYAFHPSEDGDAALKPHRHLLKKPKK